MKLKQFSLLLVLILCIGCLSGCGSKQNETPAEAESPVETESPAETGGDSFFLTDDEAAAQADAEAAARYEKYKIAYGKYSPDTVVLTVNGKDILWRDFFSWLYDIMSQLESAYEVTDWSAEFPALVGYADDPSYGGYAFSYAATNAMQIAVISAKAEELGVALTEEQLAELESSMESYYNYFDGEDAFREYIATLFLDEDYFRAQNEAALLYAGLFEAVYGENGANLPEEDAVAYMKDSGYLYAKHILFMTVDDERNPLSDEEIAEKHAQAEEVLEKLKASPAATLEESFDALMNEYSEDTGLMSYPNGYYFTAGEMVPEFENAARELGDNEFSDIVESTYGYHILFCPPMEADDEIGYDSNYMPITVRSSAAAAMFGNTANDWFTSAVILPAPEFQDPDLNAMLAS